MVGRTVELTLRTLQDAGFTPVEAARTFPVLLHYTVGFTIEEQARSGAAYDQNPYDRGLPVDADRYPLTAAVAGELFTGDSFEHGLRVTSAGMATLTKSG